MSVHFSDELLRAIGAWQQGWLENQERKGPLAEQLIKASKTLPSTFRSVDRVCYRKRYIHKGEMVELFLNDLRVEGPASWTTDLGFAESFKGLYRSDAIAAAVFEHKPSPSEVVVNIEALWRSPDFVAAAKEYQAKGNPHADALHHFADHQGEIVLIAPLRGSELIRLSGASSSFDDLCDHIGLPEDERGPIFRRLVEKGEVPGEMRYIDREACRRVVENTLRKLGETIQEKLRGANDSSRID